MTVDTTSIEPDGIPRSSWLWRGPMTKKNCWAAVILFIPGNSFPAGSIVAQRAEFDEILRRLVRERDARADACVNYDMRVQIQHVGQGVEIDCVPAFFAFQLKTNLFVRVFEEDVLTFPETQNL